MKMSHWGARSDDRRISKLAPAVLSVVSLMKKVLKMFTRREI